MEIARNTLNFKVAFLSELNWIINFHHRESVSRLNILWEPALVQRSHVRREFYRKVLTRFFQGGMQTRFILQINKRIPLRMEVKNCRQGCMHKSFVIITTRDTDTGEFIKSAVFLEQIHIIKFSISHCMFSRSFNLFLRLFFSSPVQSHESFFSSQRKRTEK